jgi:hypothetical protein
MLLALLAAVIRSRATHPRDRGRDNPRQHRRRTTAINDELRVGDLLSFFMMSILAS